MSAITIEGARKAYGTGRSRREAVRDVSINVARGSVHGLLGPNGAGKTTTLKMLLGLVRPSGGHFEIMGEPASPAARSRVGFLPEQPYFSKQLTGIQVLRLFGRLSGLPSAEIDHLGAELLERVGLGGREKVTLDTYSRGMLQRLGIAQSLIGSPDVLVLDEPASGLDPVGQRDVRDLILELREGGTSVLLSSHQLSEVEAVCDAVSILNAGNVASEGVIDELLNVAGQTSFRVKGDGDQLPRGLEDLALDVAVSRGIWVFSVPDDSVRRVVDALDDEGWVIQAVAPKRESLEEYFARLLEATRTDGDAS